MIYSSLSSVEAYQRSTSKILLSLPPLPLSPSLSSLPFPLPSSLSGFCQRSCYTISTYVEKSKPSRVFNTDILLCYLYVCFVLLYHKRKHKVHSSLYCSIKVIYKIQYIHMYTYYYLDLVRMKKFKRKFANKNYLVFYGSHKI